MPFFTLRPLPFTLMVLSGAVACGPVRAADEISEEMTVTAHRYGVSSRELVGQVSQIREETIAVQGHTHIQELTVRVPGVWMSRGNGQELLAAVRSPIYTGAGSCGEVLIAENEVPIRPSGLCNVNQMFEVNTEQAAGVDVWRGSGTVFYGSNAVHGVINTLTPDMGSEYLTLEAGPHDYYRSKLAAGLERGNQRWHLAVNGVTDGGLKADAGYDQQKFTLQHQWQGEVDVHTLLTGVNLNQETAGYITGEEAYRHSGWKDNPNPEAFRDGQALRWASQVSWHTSEHSQWQLTPYARYSEMEFLQHYLPGQPVEKNGQTSAGFQLSNQWTLTEQWRLWSGVDAEWADMWVEEKQPDVFIVPDNARYQGAHYDFSVTSQQWAAFLNTEWQWQPGAALEAGVRWESLNYDYDNHLLAGSTQADGSACSTSDGQCRYERPADREDRFDNLSAQVGARYALNDQWQVYGRLARAYRAPQINERYRLLAGQSVGQFDEKTIDSLEAGLRYSGDQLFAELSGYRMEKQDEVLKASNNATIGDAETRHQGLELQLTYAFAPAWQLSTAVTWSRHEVEKASFLNGVDVSGNTMDTAPEWLASAQLVYQPDTRWWFQLETVYMDDYYLDAENEHRYDGHTLVNAIARVQLNSDWSARLRLQNLTDQRYAERADYAFGSYRYFTGEDRAAYLELRRVF